jgi:deazaflavin-dependent oxidoreductase (nitroreductase family)
MYKQLDGAYAVFASKGGADSNPAWFHNLVANPETSIEIGSDKIDVTARLAQGEERQRIWEPWKREYPQFASYEEKTARNFIPVVVLDPV